MNALFVLVALASQPNLDSVRIDRRALVMRHNVTLTDLDALRPMQVGNGEFAFGMDITGLQTFVPFNTMSQWGWYSSPPPAGKKVEDYQGQTWDTHGRPVRYPMVDPNQPELSQWMASNPHKINLGRIGLVLKKSDGSAALPSDLKQVRQNLDLWSGIVTSRFVFEGQPVTIKTASHATSDTVAVQIMSPLVRSGRIAAFFSCPSDQPLYLADYVGHQNGPAKLTIQRAKQKNRVELVRKLDGALFRAGVQWEGKAEFHENAEDPVGDLKIVSAEYGTNRKWVDVTPKLAAAVKDNRVTLRVTSDNLAPDPAPGLTKRVRVTYTIGNVAQVMDVKENDMLDIAATSVSNRLYLTPSSESDSLVFTCTYSNKNLPANLPSFGDTFSSSRKSWDRFWRTGGAIDLSQSKDPRWRELERRVVLSQYQMKVNAAGTLPPQESGLVNNTWYGRFHMEMVWWHKTHWALWNRWPELNRSLGIYKKLLPQAKALAKSQGYSGARWPKAIGPDGREWPHEIHALLIWQQPHPIFFAELDDRAHPTKATLQKWLPIVEASADFLATYAHFDPQIKRYILGPPVVPVSENTNSKTTRNPAFELGYWRYGLRTAQTMRKRLGLAPKKEWDQVLQNLAPLPTQDGLYVLYEGVVDMWTKLAYEHPALIGTYGLLPGDGVDKAVMARTLDRVAKTWDFNRTWGWDFPMLAMTAARLGKPELAVDFLLHSSNGFQFDEVGLATGGPYPYFPSNGGLLYAIAMMARGWDGAGNDGAPGFPRNGQWKVRWENLTSAP